MFLIFSPLQNAKCQLQVYDGFFFVRKFQVPTFLDANDSGASFRNVVTESYYLHRDEKNSVKERYYFARRQFTRCDPCLARVCTSKLNKKKINKIKEERFLSRTLINSQVFDGNSQIRIIRCSWGNARVMAHTRKPTIPSRNAWIFDTGDIFHSPNIIKKSHILQYGLPKKSKATCTGKIFHKHWTAFEWCICCLFHSNPHQKCCWC